MKGNEARVVFFLHPVDQLKDGQVSKVQPLRRSIVVTVLLLLGLLLGLGVLVFVVLQLGVQTRSQQEPVPVTERTGELVPTETEAPFDTTLEKEGSTEVTSNESQANNNSTETKLPTEIIQPGIMYHTILCHKSTLKQENTPRNICIILQWP